MIDVSELVDRSPFGRLQITTLGLCLFAMIIDGFDMQALGYCAPSIVREWGLPNATLGPVFAMGNVGVLIGSVCFSMLADRVGRRPVLIGATTFFALMMLGTTRVTTISELLLMRFAAGLGLGAIAPNVSALVAEYSPSRIRPTMIMVVGVGLTAGAAIGGFIAAELIPAYGWRSVFLVGGLIPLIVAAAMFLMLPESLPLMVLLGKSRTRLARWINAIDPTALATDQSVYHRTEAREPRVPLVALFQEGRGWATPLFWLVNFMNLLTLYSLSSWLPTVVRDAGYSTRIAVLAGTILQVGGTLGAFGLAWLVARTGFVRVLGITFLIAGASIYAAGRPGLGLLLFFVVVFVAGWCVVGNQPGLNALSGAYYPTPMRSTGVGAGLGVGRLGAIVGPMIGGQFMAAHWTAAAMFTAAAVPSLVAAATMVPILRAVGAGLGRSEQAVR